MKLNVAARAAAIAAAVFTPAAALAQSGIENPGDTAFSGRAFVNLTELDSVRGGVRQKASGTRLDLKRLYLTVDHRFTETVTGQVTSDFQYDSGTGDTELLIKKAYVQAKMSDALTLRLGVGDMPWIGFADGPYGSRYIERTLVDRTRFGTSADWGVHALGDLPGGVFSYAVSLLGGGGAEEPALSSPPDIEGRLSAKLGGATFGIGGYVGKRALADDGPPVRNTARRVNLLAAYAGKGWKVGAEYFATRDWNTVLIDREERSQGYSIYGAYALTPKIGIEARHDELEPDTVSNPFRKARYSSAAITWRPLSTLDVALAYKRDETTARGVTEREADEIGLWTQVRF